MGRKMKRMLFRFFLSVAIILMLIFSTGHGFLGYTKPDNENKIYRIWDGNLEEIPFKIPTKNENTYSEVLNKKCKELFEEDQEMQKLIYSIKKINLNNFIFNNITFSVINSSGDGMHIKLEISDYLFGLLLDWLINKLINWGFSNFMDTLNEFLDMIDLENNTIGITLISRFKQGSQTKLEPQMTAEDNVYINGSHSLVTLGFFGYISYNSVFKRGFSTYYGFGVIILWR